MRSLNNSSYYYLFIFKIQKCIKDGVDNNSVGTPAILNTFRRILCCNTIYLHPKIAC